MNDQENMSFEPIVKPQQQLSEVDQAVIDADQHGSDFESMRQWQIDRIVMDNQ